MQADNGLPDPQEQAHPPEPVGPRLGTGGVVLFAVDLPSGLQPPSSAEKWVVPPVSVDYAAARSAIVAKVERLLADLGGIESWGSAWDPAANRGCVRPKGSPVARIRAGALRRGRGARICPWSAQSISSAPELAPADPSGWLYSLLSLAVTAAGLALSWGSWLVFRLGRLDPRPAPGGDRFRAVVRRAARMRHLHLLRRRWLNTAVGRVAGFSP